MDGTCIYVVSHINGDGDHICTVGTYSSKETAKRAGENYIKIECDGWPMTGEYLRTKEIALDKWYLDENDQPDDQKGEV